MSILRDDHSVARQEVLEAGWTCVDHLEALAALIAERLQALAFPASERQLLEALRQQALAARDSLSRLIDGNSSSGA